MLGQCFYEAAIRHFVDAGILLKEESADNAVYLFGNSAECCLKSLIEVYCSTRREQILRYKYGHHIDDLTNDLFEFITNSSDVPSLDPVLGLKLQAFQLPGVLSFEHPQRRYACNGKFTLADAEQCQRATQFLIREMIKQHLDGYL